MTLLTLVPRRCIWLYLVVLLLPQVLAQGHLALFADPDCYQANPGLGSVALPAAVCFIPVGVYSVSIQQWPACDNGGNASLIMYEDTVCARNTFASTRSYSGRASHNNCWYYFGPDTIPAVMFTCEQPALNPQPTSTSTLTSVIAGVATSSAIQSKATGASTLATVVSSTSGTADPGTTSAGGGGGGDSTSNGSTTTNSSSSGLSTSDKIALGVGLGVGVPTILIALVAWCFPCR